jgi:hypothetical protein
VLHAGAGHDHDRSAFTDLNGREGSMRVPASALLLLRLLLTLMVVAAAWRFGLRGVLALLLAIVAIIALSKAGNVRRDLED